MCVIDGHVAKDVSIALGVLVVDTIAMVVVVAQLVSILGLVLEVVELFQIEVEHEDLGERSPPHCFLMKYLI
jgi:hypothetical protein